MKTIILLLLGTLMLCGCVGNKAEAEVTGIKIERKPSASEEAKNWVDAFNNLLGRDDGSATESE